MYRPHHDLLIGGDTYTVGAAIASKCHFIRAARCVITQTRPLHFAAVSFLFQREISAVSRPIAAKLCHMIGNGAVLKTRLGVLPPKKFVAEKQAFSVRFRTTWHFDREYLRNGTRYRQSENSVANYDLFRVC